MQRAVVTEQKIWNLNVTQENAMLNLAAVQSVVPLRECKLSALAATVQWLYQRRCASAQRLSPDTGKALLQIISSMSRIAV